MNNFVLFFFFFFLNRVQNIIWEQIKTKSGSKGEKLKKQKEKNIYIYPDESSCFVEFYENKIG